MPTLAERYHAPGDLPGEVAVFPLRRAILLPRAVLPLSVFEPRYLTMLDEVMGTERVLAIVQPAAGVDGESPPGKAVALRKVGCVGRVTTYQEFDDGRLGIALTGIARCILLEEVATPRPYRLWRTAYTQFLGDLVGGTGEADVDRQKLLAALKAYLEARNQRVDWSAISRASTESLVNLLAIASPYGPEEKQALLEAPTLQARAEALVALAEMELAAGPGGTGSTLQ